MSKHNLNFVITSKSRRMRNCLCTSLVHGQWHELLVKQNERLTWWFLKEGFNKEKIATEFRTENPVRPNATWARRWIGCVEQLSLYRCVRKIPVQPNVVLNDASKICRRNLRTRMWQSHDPEALLFCKPVQCSKSQQPFDNRPTWWADIMRCCHDAHETVPPTKKTPSICVCERKAGNGRQTTT